MSITISKQIQLLIKHVQSIHASDITPDVVDKVVQWTKDLPEDGRPPELLSLLHTKLGVGLEEIPERLKHKGEVNAFDDLVPETGWLHDYIKYTANTEPPTVFHFFAGLTAIAGALARNVFFEMGAYQIFPALWTVIVAPSGRCRKTSACNVAMGLYRSIGGHILADKTTPEALVSSFGDRSSATGVIYAPEFAVFLGKQKYNEGMVPLLTALADCPKEWSSATIMRGESTLRNVAISFLVCSTMDWIQGAIPRDAFGGGFMSRLLFVVQNNTPRCFPHPPPMDKALEHKLKEKLFAFTKVRGAFKITPEADEWYVDWYKHRSETISADKQFAGYVERKADHMHRIAMLLAVAEINTEQHEDLILTRSRLEHALSILNWLENLLPAAFSEMSQTGMGEESLRMLKQLKQKGGVLKHSEWLNMNIHRMNKIQFDNTVKTLREAKLVDYDSVMRSYFLTPDGYSR